VKQRNPFFAIAMASAFALIILLALVECRQAKADETYLLLNGKAFHLDRKQDVHYNERNYGVGIQRDFTPRGAWVPFITAAEFRDSNDNVSWYAGGGTLWRFQFGELHADAGVVAFAMWRPEFKSGHPFIAVLPAFSVGGERVALNFTYIPPAEPKMVPILFLQLKVKL
jgi:hypothetical protein